MGNFPFATNLAIALQTATPGTGYALVNGTGTILSWTPPNDGKLHRVDLHITGIITSATTGGQISLVFNTPDGVQNSFTIGGTNGSLGFDYQLGVTYHPVIQGGAAVTLTQASALTGGAEKIWAEIWGS